MKNNGSIFSAGTRVARILFLFSFCFLSLYSYAVNVDEYVQNKMLTVEVQNKTVKEVLDYIEKNSEFIFFYYNKAVDTERNVSLSIKDKPITVILDQLFQGTDVRYEIRDRQISLKKEPIQQFPQDKQQQKRKLTGTVTDASTGEPLVGVSIMVRGENRGTITGIDGSFSIEVYANTELQFSYIGYKMQSMKVGNLQVINIKMVVDDAMLDEVVVVGYGTQKKVNLSGAVETVTAKELSNRATNNVGLALQGLVPNLNITMSSGGADYTPTFNIRGETSINGGEPLILVDGVPVTAADFSRMNSLDPEGCFFGCSLWSTCGFWCHSGDHQERRGRSD